MNIQPVVSLRTYIFLKLIKFGVIAFFALFALQTAYAAVCEVINFFTNLYMKITLWVISTWNNICGFFSEYGWIFNTVFIVIAALGLTFLVLYDFKEYTGRELKISKWLHAHIQID